MSLNIENSMNNLSSIYKYNNLKNPRIISHNKINTPSINTNNNVTNVFGVKYGDDTKQALIEDKKIYDTFKGHGELSNVEFGSEEWNQWKINHTNNFFPPLNAPAKVRQAWSEVRASIPSDDKAAIHEFTKQTFNLAYYIHFPNNLDTGLPKNFQLNTPRDYEYLLDLDTKRNSFFSEICPSCDKERYIKNIELNQQLKAKLHEVLFGV